MRRLVVAMSLVVWVSACGDTPPPPTPVPPPVEKPKKPVVAQLGELKGAVSVKRDGKVSPAEAGALYEGDVVSTGSDGHAVLKAGAREIELLEGSSFTVGKSLADLVSATGELFFEEADGGAFDTANGSARTGAGSRVRLDTRDGGSTLSVQYGEFDFVEFDGGVSQVRDGGRLVLSMGDVQFEEAAPPTPAARPTVHLQPRGTVMVKSKSGANAKLPQTGKDVDEVSQVNVDRAGQLSATMGGVNLVLEGGAKASLEPTTNDPKLRATLVAGGMRVFLKQGESVLLDGKKPLTLRAKTALTAVVTPGKDGARVELVVGDGEVALPEGLPRNVSAGEAVAPKGKTLEATKRGVPVLTLAAGRTTRVFWGKPGDVALAVPEGDGAVEVATDAQFENVVARGDANEPLVVPAPVKGGLFWRRAGEAEPSGGRFERDEFAGAVQAKSDTVAETGLKASVYFQSAVPTLTFTFPPKDGASAWRFRVYATSDLKTALVDRKVTENRAVVESGVLKEGNYVWSAVPLDKSGQEGEGGRMNKMEVVFDNSLTRLVLSSPRDGERAANATGVAPLGSKLYLNGKLVPLDGSGRFSAPTGTANVLVFRLVTPGGGEAFWVRRQSK